MSVSFGPHLIRQSEVFLTTALCTAFVNLRPIVPGHVLVIPTRVVARFCDLSSEEVCDLFQTAQRIGRIIEPLFEAKALTVAMQDGPEAGQSVPHVHVHVMPRKLGDFVPNDRIYDHINQWCHKPQVRIDNEDRPARSLLEMEQEAGMLRQLFL